MFHPHTVCWQQSSGAWDSSLQRGEGWERRLRGPEQASSGQRKEGVSVTTDHLTALSDLTEGGRGWYGKIANSGYDIHVYVLDFLHV